jgi:hypothetical protein
MYLKILLFSIYFILLSWAGLNLPFWASLVFGCTVAIILAARFCDDVYRPDNHTAPVRD